MRFRLLLGDGDGAPPRRKEGPRSDPFASERWPRTPRVIRWAWAGTVTALVVSEVATGRTMDPELMIRVAHVVAELLDTRAAAPAPYGAPAPAPAAGRPRPIPAPIRPDAAGCGRMLQTRGGGAVPRAPPVARSETGPRYG